MNKYEVLLIVSFCLLLIGCRESYPSIADPNANEVDEVIPSESEADLTPIMPTLSSPQFSFVTRAEGGGTGPFESWGEDREHWLGADFHVFAYQTTNSYGGVVNMEATDDGQLDDKEKNERNGAFSDSPCLLYDRIMRVSDPQQGSVRFVNRIQDANGYNHGTSIDTIYYYRINANTKKYNFFTFFADDAVQKENGSFFKRYKDNITCRIKINGRQDIMHSFAYHLRSDFEDQVEKLSGILSKDQMNVLTAPNSYYQMLYSTVTGHRGINPIFRIRHLLSKFTVNILGKELNESKGATDSLKISEDFRNIIISEVRFCVPSTGTMYIARDEWGHPATSGKDLGEEYERQVANGELIIWDSSTDTLAATIHNNRRTINGEEDPVYQNIRNYQTKNLFHVLSTETDSSSIAIDPILLPPIDSFYIELKGHYLNYLKGQEGQLNPKEPILEYNLPPSLVKLSVAPYRFEPGKAYTINVYVYGYQHVNIVARLDKNWIQVDTPIIVDEDPGDK